MRTITVKCPKCREVLEVDPKSGEVVRHAGEVAPKAGGDFFGERLRQIQGDQARREAIVAEGREKEKVKREQFEELFRKAKEQKTVPPEERPIRDVDID